MEDSKESRLESKADNISNYPANIGLLEESNHDSESMFISIPREIDEKKDDKIIFLENPLLKSQEWALDGWKNMKQGAKDGAKLGFELGAVVCAIPAFVTTVSVCSTTECPAEALIGLQLAMCGGTVASVSFVPGGILGPMLYPFTQWKYLEDFSFAKQTIVQEVWRDLIKMNQIRRLNSLQVNKGDENNKYGMFEFGLDERPFDGFVQIKPLQLQLVHAPYRETAEQLMLRITVQLTLLDKNKEKLIKVETQVEEGPYTFMEWTDEEGLLLKTRMEKMYQKLAEQIVLSLQMDVHSLPSKHQASKELMH